MNRVLKELAFEESIEAHLLANGWTKRSPAAYDRSLFNAFFEKPGFKEALPQFLAGAYDGFRHPGSAHRAEGA